MFKRNHYPQTKYMDMEDGIRYTIYTVCYTMWCARRRYELNFIFNASTLSLCNFAQFCSTSVCVCVFCFCVASHHVSFIPSISSFTSGFKVHKYTHIHWHRHSYPLIQNIALKYGYLPCIACYYYSCDTVWEDFICFLSSYFQCCILYRTLPNL